MTLSTATSCPYCNAELTAPLSTGKRLCLTCQREWVPGETVELDAVRAVSEARANDDIDLDDYRPDAATQLALSVARARAQLIGTDVIVHSVGEQGRAIEVTDDGYVRVEFGSGFYIDCLPDDFSEAETTDIGDDVVQALGAIDIQVAAQVVRAARATLLGDDDARTLGMPPNGWAPDDAGAIPVLEHGAAYAVAMVANLCGMSNADLEQLATQLDNAAQAAREATGQ